MIEDFELLAEGHLSGDLTPEETRRFTAHLAACAECSARFEAHREAASRLALLVTTPLAPMSPGFTDTVMRKLPPAAPPAGRIWPFALAGAALIAAGAVAFVAKSRPRPAPVLAPASPSVPPRATPSAAVAPTPVPSVARPKAAVGGLGDDTGGGSTEH